MLTLLLQSRKQADVKSREHFYVIYILTTIGLGNELLRFVDLLFVFF